MSPNDKGPNSSIDDEGYIPFIDYLPLNISKASAKARSLCKSDNEKRLWDCAIKECIKTTILDACGHPGPQIDDMKWLMFEEWSWRNDEDFMKELRERFE